VNNDGAKEKANGQAGRSRLGRVALLQRVLKDTQGRYQLLCANCNQIKAWESNQCRLLAASKEHEIG
jgi:hypothetical protein